MKTKTIVILCLFLIFVIILFQNLNTYPIQLLFWEFNISRIILFPIILLFGILIGFIMGRKKRNKFEGSKEEEI